MKKQASGSMTKDTKTTGSNKSASQNKTAKSSQTTARSNESATAKVKAKAGHGLANEGTNVDYQEER